eukprot:12199003-Heterocapsa_arctica.AAC.1
MVENHKDKIFQKREETEAIRKIKNRTIDHDINNQELDHMHRYVHQGLLQVGIQVDSNIVAIQVDQGNEEQDQHTAGNNHEI